jgi:hypothetical protein
LRSIRQASALTASRQRAPRVVCKRLLGGSERRVVSPMVRSSRTVQPVLQSVMCAYLPQFVAHTPCRPQTNRFGLATDCTCNTPTKGKRLTRPDRTDVVTRTIVVTKGIIHVEAARRKSHHSKSASTKPCCCHPSAGSNAPLTPILPVKPVSSSAVNVDRPPSAMMSSIGT